jgi:hypothetical protein
LQKGKKIKDDGNLGGGNVRIRQRVIDEGMKIVETSWH